MWYPFELLHRQRAVLVNTAEWQSVDFHTLYGKLAMAMILALLAAAWVSRQPWRASRHLADLVCRASLTHVRFLIFASIIVVPMLAPRLRLFAPYDAKRDKHWLNLAMTAAIVGIMLWAYPTTATLQEPMDTQLPHDALRFIQQRHITGRLFSWGRQRIYRVLCADNQNLCRWTTRYFCV